MLDKRAISRLVILQRKVFSVDTEAGYNLRYHITRALACEDYAIKIGFVPSQDILSIFLHFYTREGSDYWFDIYKLIYDRS